MRRDTAKRVSVLVMHLAAHRAVTPLAMFRRRVLADRMRRLIAGMKSHFLKSHVGANAFPYLEQRPLLELFKQEPEHVEIEIGVDGSFLGMRTTAGENIGEVTPAILLRTLEK